MTLSLPCMDQGKQGKLFSAWKHSRNLDAKQFLWDQ